MNQGNTKGPFLSPAEPVNGGSSSDGSSDKVTSSKDSTDSCQNAATPPGKPRWRVIARKACISGLLLMVLGALGLGGAEYYTARPDFCGTCHVMDPYYLSWSSDKHGSEHHVKCIECHYAPGEKYTFKAKFKGLSQVASYFSGRYGSARPRAHVSNASCLVSGCHGDNAFREKKLMLGKEGTEKRLVGDKMTDVERHPTVQFVHEKHLGGAERLGETDAQILEIETRLRAQLSPEAMREVVDASKSILPSAERDGELTDLVRRGVIAPEFEEDARQLLQLEHRRLRLEQLHDLNCTACHTYDASGQNHFAVALTTCFTCHFTNQTFNSDTGRCLTCHEAPTRQFIVHGTTTTTDGVTKTAMMDHREIIDRGINCASCHFDVIQGDAVVSVRDCQRCHDSDKFLKDFADRDTRTVSEYHRIHVHGQRAHCLDCHRTVKHELISAEETTASGDFLRPVLNDCQHCHPKHHEEQVTMLMGEGGKGPVHPMPNAMFGSRLNCRGCHTQSGSDFKGDRLIKATQATCVACHSTDYEKLFNQWMSEIENYLSEAEAALKRVDAKVAEMRGAGTEPAAETLALLEQARANIHYVATANGIHNKNYAMQLLEMSIRDLDDMILRLSQ
ncbi:MAG: NapC/NirT family cytochrome c [Phycisphaerae bacterium]|nr:NapC/NirT family cytochrome c [Phycisphaerae bacterium]